MLDQDNHSKFEFYNYIYYGVYKNNPSDDGNPIRWRVLTNTNGNGGTYKDMGGNDVDPTNAMFLLSEYLLGEKIAFGTDNIWSTSNLKQWIQNTYNGAFSP